MEKEKLDELKEHAAELFGVKPGDITLVHVSETPKPCDHDWDNEGMNPEQCLKCGMSFTRYIFTECP